MLKKFFSVPSVRWFLYAAAVTAVSAVAFLPFRFAWKESNIFVHAAEAGGVNVWWPTNGANIGGTQPFKAQLSGWDVKDYMLFWQVDGGQYNWMSDNYADYPHKEAQVDVSGWKWRGAGPYTLTFIAQKWSGEEIVRTSVTISIPSSAPTVAAAPAAPASAPAPAPTPTPTPTPAPAPATTVQTTSSGAVITTAAALSSAPAVIAAASPSSAPVATAPTPAPATPSNPISGKKLYINPNSPAAAQAKTWQYSWSYGSSLMQKIAAQPSAQWFGGWNANIRADANTATTAAANAGALPVYIAYNVPFRDCGGYSAGGATTAEAYRNWIQALASGIGSRPAVVILEPDGLASIDCLSGADQSARLSLLSGAVHTLKANGKTSVYIDAGNAHWISAGDMARRLQNAGIGEADGFALNVSNFFTTDDNLAYGNTLSGLLGGKHYVIDTSRNGLGPTSNSEWCNPQGRALGIRPTANTGTSNADAFLWLKTPGESDGSCNGGPSAGTWWSDYAVGLSERAAY